MKYLGIHINRKLNWSIQCQMIAAKATKVLNVLRHTMFGCDLKARGRAYKAIVRPLLEYACVVMVSTYFKRCQFVGNCAEMCCMVDLW